MDLDGLNHFVYRGECLPISIESPIIGAIGVDAAGNELLESWVLRFRSRAKGDAVQYLSVRMDITELKKLLENSVAGKDYISFLRSKNSGFQFKSRKTFCKTFDFFVRSFSIREMDFSPEGSLKRLLVFQVGVEKDNL